MDISDCDPAGLAESFRRRARRGPERPAVSFEGRTWSYGELQSRAERLSAELAAGGVAKGDRVGYLGFNHPLQLAALFAAARLGAMLVPLNYRLAGPELEYIIGDADIHTLLVDAHHVALIDELRPRLSCRRYLATEPGAGAGWEDLAVALEIPREAPPAVNGAPEDVVLLIYTSGTTGRPKGAMLSNGNVWTNNLNWLLTSDFTSRDVTLAMAPMFHVGGLCVVLFPTLFAGGHVVLQRAFDALAFLHAVEEFKVTVSFGVPAMMLFISQHEYFARADLSSLRLIIAGGAPVPEPLLRLYGERNIPVSQCYGQTEATAGLTFLETDRAIAKLGSCGRAGLLNEVRLRGFDGRPITEPNVPGEIRARGGNVIQGYWKLPEASAQARDEDGWFRTGDVAYFDEEGFFHICDRLKDMIISGGENVYPAEVESVVYAHPAVAEVAVIGAPDDRWGERVVAVVVLKAGEALDLDTLRDFAEARLARYKLPRELQLIDAMPRNPNGKVDKLVLRKRFAAD
ncbi:MAG: long-chain fatty acid--CoA ligase [Rudaea sp.]|uniref:acyl-CoA synthetase n=1 Tax=Rudaea sp. TaxID=2136325 RepID=UPI0039E49977